MPIPPRPRRGDGFALFPFDPTVHLHLPCGLRKEGLELERGVVRGDFDDGTTREEGGERDDEHEWSTF